MTGPGRRFALSDGSMLGDGSLIDGAQARQVRLADGSALLLALLAATVVAAGLGLGWRGVDLPAQLYRVDLFRQHGFTLWDSQWFGGHWTLDYSVLFPAVAAAVGVGVVTVASAGAAALAFDRLVVGHFGRQARAASVVFALGVTVQSSIGQLTFLLGEAAGLWCLVLLARRNWLRAGVLGALAALFSPLAGAFVGLAVVTTVLASRPSSAVRSPSSSLAVRSPSSSLRSSASWWPSAWWWPASWRHVRVSRADLGAARAPMLVLVAVGLPVAVTALLFPGQGPMPYPGIDFAWELVVTVGLWAVTPRADRVVRTGLVLYAMAMAVSAAVPTPLGGNIGRLEDCVALPLTVAVLWPGAGAAAAGAVGVVRTSRQRVRWHTGSRRDVLARRRDVLGGGGDVLGRGRDVLGRRAVIGRRRAVLAVAAVPLVLSQWSPAWPAMTSNGAQPWAHPAYYQRLSNWLLRHSVPAGRVEVVPTADHWEAAYVAPVVALARGWERQLDVADNPLFYRRAALDPASYRAWLLDNGVRYVALPSAPLDEAAVAEGRLVSAGVPGLHPVWHHGGWRVYAVDGSPGIVGPGGHLVRLDGGQLSVAFDAPASVVVRVRFSPSWRVLSGVATITEAPGRWIDLATPAGGNITLGLRVLG